MPKKSWPDKAESALLQERLEECAARLKKSERQLADTQRVAHLGSWECDLAAGGVRWSDETYRIFGLDPEEVPASDESFLGRVHLDDRERVKEALREALQEGGGIHNLQFRILRPDGSLRLVVGNGEVVRDSAGTPVSMIGTCHDVTEYRMAQVALGESEQRFSKIFQAAPALVSITTVADGVHLEVNAAFLKALHYERGEVIGRSGLELDLWVNPGDRAVVVQALREKREVRELEVLLRGKTGAHIEGLLSAELIEINGKEFLVTLVNDITERKKAQEEQARLAAIVHSSTDAIASCTSPNCDSKTRLIGAATFTMDLSTQRQAQQQIDLLVSRLAARTRELEEVVPELEAFNYTVSHDLRTPLTAISGYCNCLKAECSRSLDERCLDFLEEIEAAAERMESLIDTLLEFSRLSRADLKKEPVDLSVMAREVSASLQLAEPERQVRVEIADGVVVQGDPGMLRVVLGNLFGNAWKYTSERESALIEFGVTIVNGMRACYLRDNGVGFDMDDAGAMFRPFARLSGADSFKGFGIGLATVKRIISRHGGKVWGEGEKGRGATFYFSL